MKQMKRITLRLSLEKPSDKKISDFLANIDKNKYHTVKMKRINIFPERFTYFYAGFNNKSLPIMKRMESIYKSDCIVTAVEYWRATVWAGQEYSKHFSKRKFNICDDSLINLYLLAMLGGNESTEKEYLKSQCFMEKINSIVISLNTQRMQLSLSNEVNNEDISWVYEIAGFIDNELVRCLEKGFLYANGDMLYFQINDIEKYYVDSIDIFNFFEKLVTLFDAKYSISILIGDDEVSCDDLSEGQRQLIKMLGMLGICKTEDSLVLMDEPDAHMNPKWKYEIKETIDRSINEAINTQAIIATHDPLVINGVAKDFIRIFIRRDKSNTTEVITPTEDTEGMGIDGLLQSEYYGLRTSYDKEATQKFVRRQELYEKLINKEIEEVEKEELRKLTKEVASMPMSNNSIDFLYDDFIKVFRNTEYYKKEYLSFDEMQERRKKIEEIIRILYEGQV